MRLISQHGNVDLPYEQMVVCHAMESVIALYNGEKYILGKYSSKEKAYKAMEMLREHNEGVNFLKTIINTEKGTQFVSVLPGTVFNKMTQNYFQFPQDDEIEV
jgi:hypothetical protein